MAQLKNTTINGHLDITDVIRVSNNKGIQGLDSDGNYRQNFQPCNASNNCIIGYDNYVNANGNTHIYGNDVRFYIASAGQKNFCPYYKVGNTISFNIRTAGFVTNSSQDVYFVVPTTVPIIGSPTATATSVSGFMLRQENKYTHGSTASAYVTPASYTVTVNQGVGFIVMAKFSDITNAINNSPIGIHWSGNITLA